MGEWGQYERKISTSFYKFRYSFSSSLFLPVIVRGRTMGKLVSIVTTHLFGLSSRIIFDKYLLGRRTMRRIVMVTTNRHGLRRPIILKFLLLLPSLPLTASMTNRHRHNDPSWVFVPKHFNSWNLGTGTNSQNLVTDLQDGPSWVRRSVTLSVTPHLLRLPYLPSKAALRCYLRTVTSMMDRHKLRRWSLRHFFAQKPPHSSLDRFPVNKEKLI